MTFHTMDDEYIFWPYVKSSEQMLEEKDAEIKELEAKVDKLERTLEGFKKVLLNISEIVDKAPHSFRCAGWHGHPEWGNLFVDDCDCWKKELK